MKDQLSDKQLDEFLKDRFSDFGDTPSGAVWEGVNAGIVEHQAIAAWKLAGWYKWLSMLLGVALISTVVFFFWPNQNPEEPLPAKEIAALTGDKNSQSISPGSSGAEKNEEPANRVSVQPKNSETHIRIRQEPPAEKVIQENLKTAKTTKSGGELPSHNKKETFTKSGISIPSNFKLDEKQLSGNKEKDWTHIPDDEWVKADDRNWVKEFEKEETGGGAFADLKNSELANAVKTESSDLLKMPAIDDSKPATGNQPETLSTSKIQKEKVQTAKNPDAGDGELPTSKKPIENQLEESGKPGPINEVENENLAKAETNMDLEKAGMETKINEHKSKIAHVEQEKTGTAEQNSSTREGTVETNDSKDENIQAVVEENAKHIQNQAAAEQSLVSNEEKTDSSALAEPGDTLNKKAMKQLARHERQNNREAKEKSGKKVAFHLAANYAQEFGNYLQKRRQRGGGTKTMMDSTMRSKLAWSTQLDIGIEIKNKLTVSSGLIYSKSQSKTTTEQTQVEYIRDRALCAFYNDFYDYEVDCTHFREHLDQRPVDVHFFQVNMQRSFSTKSIGVPLQLKYTFNQNRLKPLVRLNSTPGANRPFRLIRPKAGLYVSVI